MTHSTSLTPSLASQFEGWANNGPESLETGQQGRDKMDPVHAIYVVVDSMQSLGLSAWTANLLHFLGRFDGLEMHLDEECHPLLCTRQVLLSHVANMHTQRDLSGTREMRMRQLIDDLMQLEFMHHRHYWCVQPPHARVEFNPLEHSWLDFVAMGLPQEQLCGFRPERGNPQWVSLWKEKLLNLN
ncbi:hypothetical protein E9531_17065 [Lampropedia puyangensis]|uniref:Uncharacterized protein n=1 Tax=Lampropedia puyangensis TaxID=1330072 RepID=A0A4S8EN50_9BURK|nr:hypothetical protein [Lampropedia puyangensis]THT95548.1 hypothetical protein E9531_17065 [Lampropedia puyangensis]